MVAQWLDDLDDLIVAIPLTWERLRQFCLRIGLIAALSFAAAELSRIATVWAPGLAATAAVSVGIWLIGVLAGEMSRLRESA